MLDLLVMIYSSHPASCRAGAEPSMNLTATARLLNTLLPLFTTQFHLAMVGGTRISHIYTQWRLIKIGVVSFCPTQTSSGTSTYEETRFVVGTKIALVLGQLPSLVWAKFGEKNGSNCRYYNSKGNSKQCELHHLLQLQPGG